MAGRRQRADSKEENSFFLFILLLNIKSMAQCIFLPTSNYLGHGLIYSKNEGKKTKEKMYFDSLT